MCEQCDVIQSDYRAAVAAVEQTCQADKAHGLAKAKRDREHRLRLVPHLQVPAGPAGMEVQGAAMSPEESLAEEAAKIGGVGDEATTEGQKRAIQEGQEEGQAEVQKVD